MLEKTCRFMFYGALAYVCYQYLPTDKLKEFYDIINVDLTEPAE